MLELRVVLYYKKIIPRKFFIGRAIGFLIVLVLAGGYFVFQNSFSGSSEESTVSYKDITYLIDNEPVKLVNGKAEQEIAPGSAVKKITQYFGNELKADLNEDDREDLVFLLTQNSGGSGTFFYAVAALNTDKGYVGSDGYLLGDRIAPQTINLSQNPRHKNVVAVNYADRAPNEPMTARPSLGKTAYLKLDPQTMRWGIVMADFEGESR